MDVKHIGSGKVRELFEVGGNRLLLVASDRISAYDVVLPQVIPDKGRVLTGLSAFWFQQTESICPNHLVTYQASRFPEAGPTDLVGRAMLCRMADPIPVEFVVRGFLAGSGWKEYRETQTVCGHRLPAGLVESDRLPEPILTPATKATTGHDENITEEAAARIAGEETYETAKEYALRIYEHATKLAQDRGVIIADTKFEFGIINDSVVLIDEVLTPDSSRFWPEDSYEPGRPQPSFDKQYVRDWLDHSGWDHRPPAPDLPEDVIAATRQRYLEAYERITGRSFDSWLQEAAD
jgi:phosphoribosylaminoimidazole-succinocarboxamide synthase